MSIFKLISEGQRIIIPACDGSQSIARATETFAWIDPDFNDWKLEYPGQPTHETPVRVFEQQENATFKEMVKSLRVGKNKLCFEQDQIIAFCKTHKEWLREGGGGTFFFFKKGRNFFVAGVSVRADGLDVGVCPFGYDLVWGGGCRPRLVVPQLTL